MDSSFEDTIDEIDMCTKKRLDEIFSLTRMRYESRIVPHLLSIESAPAKGKTNEVTTTINRTINLIRLSDNYDSYCRLLIKNLFRMVACLDLLADVMEEPKG